jgi:hypothetical protein
MKRYVCVCFSIFCLWWVFNLNSKLNSILGCLAFVNVTWESFLGYFGAFFSLIGCFENRLSSLSERKRVCFLGKKSILLPNRSCCSPRTEQLLLTESPLARKKLVEKPAVLLLSLQTYFLNRGVFGFSKILQEIVSEQKMLPYQLFYCHFVLFRRGCNRLLWDANF